MEKGEPLVLSLARLEHVYGPITGEATGKDTGKAPKTTQAKEVEKPEGDVRRVFNLAKRVAKKRSKAFWDRNFGKK